MSLKDAIKDKHDKAESHRFVKVLLSGAIPAQIYADYLMNQMLCYTKLESLAKNYGLLNGIEDIQRVEKMQRDLIDLGLDAHVFDSTADYVEYLNTVAPEQLLAHVYVRHFGDMYGGQMIKKVVPGKGAMYEFEDRTGLIAKVRALLTDELGEEANKAFDFNLRLFDELADAYNLPTT